MPNRIGRARHLTLVPDLPDEPSPSAGSSPETGRVAAVPSGIAQLTLDVRVESQATAVWRRIRVRSDLLLPEFQVLITAVMGWPSDDHYSFSAGRKVFCPAATMQPGVHSADHVRIDSMLAGRGDQAQFSYRDSLAVSLRVVSVDTDVDDLRPRCLEGENTLDVAIGSVPSADVLTVRRTPADTTLDEAVNRLRAVRTLRTAEAESAAASPLVARLFQRLGSTPAPALSDLLPRCELTIESSVDLPAAQMAMTKMMWFLRAVGSTGIELTHDGRLPPAVVTAVRDELDWGIGWVGAGTSEIEHHQATDLREAMKALGLVRVSHGLLVRTKIGTSLMDDAIGLWHRCASRLPLGRRAQEQDAGTLFLVALAASVGSTARDGMIVEVLRALGWGGADLSVFEAQKIAHPTVALLDLIGAHGPLFYLGSGASEPPSWSRRFARDALRASRSL